jgi:hypothetical protein
VNFGVKNNISHTRKRSIDEDIDLYIVFMSHVE